MVGHRTSATHVPLLCSGLISHSAYLIKMLARKGGPSVQEFRLRGTVLKKTQILRTRCGRANASSRVDNHVKLDIKHRFLETTSEHVPSEADHLLCPSEGMDHIVDLWAQTRVTEYGEFVDPRVVDLTGVTEPEYRVLRMIGIRDDGSHHTNLKSQERCHHQFTDVRGFDAKPVRLARETTHVCAGFWARSIVERSPLGCVFQL